MRYEIEVSEMSFGNNRRPSCEILGQAGSHERWDVYGMGNCSESDYILATDLWNEGGLCLDEEGDFAFVNGKGELFSSFRNNFIDAGRIQGIVNSFPHDAHNLIRTDMERICGLKGIEYYSMFDVLSNSERNEIVAQTDWRKVAERGRCFVGFALRSSLKDSLEEEAKKYLMFVRAPQNGKLGFAFVTPMQTEERAYHVPSSMPRDFYPDMRTLGETFFSGANDKLFLPW